MTAQHTSPSSVRRRFCYLPERTKHGYDSSEQYCDAVRNAITQYQVATSFYKQAQSEYQNTVLQQQFQQAQAVQVQQGGPVHTHNIHIQINRGAAYIQLPNGIRTVTNNYRPASFVKRVLAELFDFIIFFCLKIVIVWLLIDKFELLDLSEYEKLLGNQADLQSLIDVTQSLFPYELLCKFIVTVFEAFCISFPIFPGIPSGSTPGKTLMRIRVISVRSVVPHVIPGNVTVTGLESVPLLNSVLRSLVKNVFINSLLPLSTVAFAFNQHRSLYDVMSGTMVVEAN